jgi:6,7-dimethyl-8-ribityllumazine synthase
MRETQPDNYPTMSSDPLIWPVSDARGLHFAIVVARFNNAITQKLLSGATEALEKAQAPRVEIFYVPGAFELPFAAKKLATPSNFVAKFDAIIALGAVIRGDTPHFDYVAGEAARGIMQVSLETGVPVIFGVLTTDNQEQAEARAGGSLGNKGFDAAMTAIEMAQFSTKSPVSRAPVPSSAPAEAR